MIGTFLVLHTSRGNPAPAYNYIAVFSPFAEVTGNDFVILFYHFC